MNKYFQDIRKVCERYEALCFKHKIEPCRRTNLTMDIEFADQDIPLDFDGLLATDDGNFLHDITGIISNLNRDTKKLDHCWVPRHAKREKQSIHITAIDWAIGQGYFIGVQDYSSELDEWDVRFSRDKAAIIEAIEATELPNVVIFKKVISAVHAGEAYKRLATFSVIDEGHPDETINDYQAKMGGEFDTWFEEEFNRRYGAPVTIDVGGAA